MDQSLSSMLDVSSTMLITLYARARETLSKKPIIIDNKAVEIINKIKNELVGSNIRIHKMILRNKYNKKLAITMSLRSRKFDSYVQNFLIKYPSATVINFGCGLDTRFDRIDNGKVQWYDIDFPEVIQLRRSFIKESKRHIFIPSSILDPTWMDTISSNGPFLFLAEGVFMYLQETQVKQLLEMITNRFHEYEIVCEVTNKYWVDKMKTKYMQWKFKHQLGITENAYFSFGIPNSQYFEKWNSNYRLIDDWTYFDDKEPKMGLINLFSNIELLRKVQWTVHYSISS